MTLGTFCWIPHWEPWEPEKGVLQMQTLEAFSLLVSWEVCFCLGLRGGAEGITGMRE